MPCSVPSVELMRCFDALEGPKVVSSEVHAFGVATAESFCNPRVMQSLPVSELEVAKAKTKEKPEKEATSSASVVGVEVVLHVHGLTSVIHNAKECSEGTVRKGGCASQDQADILRSEWVHVPVIRVMFDCLNSLDFAQHLFVALFKIVMVSVNV